MEYNKKINPPTKEEVNKMHKKEIEVTLGEDEDYDDDVFETENRNDTIIAKGIAFKKGKALFFLSNNPNFNGLKPEFRFNETDLRDEYREIKRNFAYTWHLFDEGREHAGDYSIIKIKGTIITGIKTTQITNQIITE